MAALAAVRRGGAALWEADARAVPALVAVALGQHPAAPPGPLPGALAAHYAGLLKRCVVQQSYRDTHLSFNGKSPAACPCPRPDPSGPEHQMLGVLQHRHVPQRHLLARLLTLPVRSETFPCALELQGPFVRPTHCCCELLLFYLLSRYISSLCGGHQRHPKVKRRDKIPVDRVAGTALALGRFTPLLQAHHCRKCSPCQKECWSLSLQGSLRLISIQEACIEVSAMVCRAAEHACAALWHTAGTAAGRQQLGSFVGELAPAAMSNHPQSSFLAQLLARLS